MDWIEFESVVGRPADVAHRPCRYRAVYGPHPTPSGRYTFPGEIGWWLDAARRQSAVPQYGGAWYFDGAWCDVEREHLAELGCPLPVSPA